MSPAADRTGTAAPVPAPVAAVAAAATAAAPVLPGALGLLLTRAAPTNVMGEGAAGAGSPAAPLLVAPAASTAAAPAPADARHTLPVAAPTASPPAVAAGGGTAGPGAAASPPMGSETAASSSSGVMQTVTSSTGAARAAAPAGAVGANGTSQLGVEDVEEGMCVVCWAAKRRVLMLPCCHLCCCSQCSLVLQAQGAPCPMCRQDVREHLKVYV
jgi:hypothetical protein